jgi:hypothetical protein
MAKRDKKVQPKQDELSGRERVHALKKIVTKSMLQSEIRRRKLQRRSSRKCPPQVMLWFVVALWLFGDDCYTGVFRWLHRFSPQHMPSSSALTQARARLGVAVMAALYAQAVRCLCSSQTPEAFYAGRRIVGVDGFVLNVPDSDSNRGAFGRPKNGTSCGAFPQVRLVALCEVGSHVFFRFLAKPIRCGEATMAKHVYRHLPQNCLLLFDIGFCAYELMRQVIDQQSDFLGRAKPSRCFRKMRVLSDGSYLSKIYASDYDRLHDRGGRTVRVIEYTLDDPQRAGHGQKHRLMTTLLDEQAHPAHTLIVLYHQRWEEEIAIAEAKTHLRHSPKLRSQTPAGVLQEIHGLLIAHFVIRKLAFEAAARAGVSPHRLSFTGTLKVLRVSLVEAPRSPGLLGAWYADLLSEISLQLLEPRRNRINPRVIKRPQSKWAKKRQKHRKLPPLQRTFDETIRLLT